MIILKHTFIVFVKGQWWIFDPDQRTLKEHIRK